MLSAVVSSGDELKHIQTSPKPLPDRSRLLGHGGNSVQIDHRNSVMSHRIVGKPVWVYSEQDSIVKSDGAFVEQQGISIQTQNRGNLKTQGSVALAGKKIPAGGYWRDLPDDLQRSYMGASYFQGGGKTGMARRLSWDEPSLTLTCNPAQKQTERCHPSETRPLNVREYARIQSFPDDWFSG